MFSTGSVWVVALCLAVLAAWGGYVAAARRFRASVPQGEPFPPLPDPSEPVRDDEPDLEHELVKLRRRMSSLEGDVEQKIARIDGQIGQLWKRDRGDAKAQLAEATQMALASRREPGNGEGGPSHRRIVRRIPQQAG